MIRKEIWVVKFLILKKRLLGPYVNRHEKDAHHRPSLQGEEEMHFGYKFSLLWEIFLPLKIWMNLISSPDI